ncbi:MAG: class I SAM-dependent methyltransferase, partial [Chloroflexota bacterium]
ARPELHAEKEVVMSYRIAIALLFILPFVAYGQDAVKRDQHQMHGLHNDPKAYIGALEDPKRDRYQKPHEVLTALDLKPGEVVADIGAGSGYFTFLLARHVGETGKVYAVDISPDMILYLNRRIRDLGVTNVASVLADEDDPLLPADSVDRFFFCDSWHHIENQTKYLSVIRKLLKPNGEIVVIDFHKKELPIGPPLRMKVAREDLIKQMEAGGFRLAKEYKFLPYQYFLVFTAGK